MIERPPRPARSSTCSWAPPLRRSRRRLAARAVGRGGGGVAAPGRPARRTACCWRFRFEVDVQRGPRRDVDLVVGGLAGVVCRPLPPVRVPVKCRRVGRRHERTQRHRHSSSRERRLPAGWSARSSRPGRRAARGCHGEGEVWRRPGQLQGLRRELAEGHPRRGARRELATVPAETEDQCGPLPRRRVGDLGVAEVASTLGQAVVGQLATRRDQVRSLDGPAAV